MEQRQPLFASLYDAELLAALHGQCLADIDDEAWQAPAIAALLKIPGTFAFMAVAEGEMPVGLVIARSAGGESEILTMGILPTYRRQGHGSALIEAAAGRADEMGAGCLFLEVAADNAAARALYHGLGFRPAGRRPGYYRRRAGRLDAIILRRDLGPA